MMWRIPGVLSGVELALMRAAPGSWHDGQRSAGPQAAAVKRNQQFSGQDGALPALQAQVLAALQRNAPFFSAAPPRRVLPPMFSRYTGQTNAYGEHLDQAIRYLPSAGGEAAQALRTALACTLILSDPQDDEGGELVLSQGLDEQAIRLPAGDLLL